MLSRSFSTGRPRVLLLAGPTSSRKTAFSVDIAEKINGEIICADSVQLYKGLDIGSGKATEAERARVVHYGLDALALGDRGSAADWANMARKQIIDTHQRGKTPIIVGGAMFYLHWLLYGPSSFHRLSSSSLAQRAAREAQANEWTKQQKAEKLGEQFRGATNRRIARALEIREHTGGPPAPLAAKSVDHFLGLPFDYRPFHLTFPRPWLMRQVDWRCERMVHAGLIGETARARASRGKEFANEPAGQAIGYRQTLDYIDLLRQGRHDAATFLSFVRGFQNATRPYVRRQLSWFRQEPAYQIVPVNPARIPPLAAIDVDSMSHYEVEADEQRRVQELIIQQFQLPASEYWAAQAQQFDKPPSLVDAPDLRKYQPKLQLFHDSSAVREAIDRALEDIKCLDNAL